MIIYPKRSIRVIHWELSNETEEPTHTQLCTGGFFSMAEEFTDVWQYNPDYNRFAEVLGIDRHERADIDVARKIAVLRDYFDIGKKLTEVQARSAVLTMKQELGVPFRGKELVDELFQHARLEMDRMEDPTPAKEVKAPVKKPEVKKEKKEVPIKKIVKEAVKGVIEEFMNTQSQKNAVEKAPSPSVAPVTQPIPTYVSPEVSYGYP